MKRKFGTAALRIEIYKARDGHRWRMRARNGKIVADGGEAYSRPSLCADAVVRLVCALQCDVVHGPGVEVVREGKPDEIVMGRIRARLGSDTPERRASPGEIKLRKRW